jgi:hypothetical protein
MIVLIAMRRSGRSTVVTPRDTTAIARQNSTTHLSTVASAKLAYLMGYVEERQVLYLFS